MPAVARLVYSVRIDASPKQLTSIRKSEHEAVLVIQWWVVTSIYTVTARHRRAIWLQGGQQGLSEGATGLNRTTARVMTGQKVPFGRGMTSPDPGYWSNNG